MKTTDAFNNGLAPFQAITFKFRDGTPLSAPLPAGHWYHNAHGSVYVPDGVLYHREDGKIGVCVGGDGVEGWQ